VTWCCIDSDTGEILFKIPDTLENAIKRIEIGTELSFNSKEKI
jgi:hypothetical protein